MSRRFRLAAVLIGFAVVGGAVLVFGSQPARPTGAAASRRAPATPALGGVAVRERWRVPLPAEVVGLPAVDAAGVVTAAGEEVVGVSLTGELRWRTPVPGVLANAPRLDGDRVLVAADGAVVSLDRTTGALQWRAELGDDDEERANRPVAVGNVVIASFASGRVLGVARDSGAPLWSLELPTASTAEPAAGDGVVVAVGIADWRAFDAATGVVLWSGDLGLFGTSSPVVFRAGEQWLAAVASDGHVIAVDLRSGALVWQSPAEHSELFQVPVVTDEHELLVPDHWGRLAAYDAASGAARWKVTGPDTMAEFGEPVLVSAVHRLVALPLDDGGPRLGSPEGSVPLRPAAPGHGVARLPDGGLVVTTWGQTPSFVLAYDIDVGV